MRFDDHRVAGGQRGKQAVVPGGKVAQPITTPRHGRRFQSVFITSAGFLPCGFPSARASDEALLAPGVGHRLQPAILGMRRAGLKTPSSSPGRWSSSPVGQFKSFAHSAAPAFPDTRRCAGGAQRLPAGAWPPAGGGKAPRAHTGWLTSSATPYGVALAARPAESGPAAPGQSGWPDALRTLAVGVGGVFAAHCLGLGISA